MNDRDHWDTKRRPPASIVVLLLFLTAVHPAHGLVWIWDSVGRQWTTTLSDGAPINPDSAQGAGQPAVATDSRGNTYLAFRQSDPNDTDIGRIYLSRYPVGGALQIWDQDARLWTTDLAAGDPIDTGLPGRSAHGPQLAVDAFDRVYVVFSQSDGLQDRIYISRLNTVDSSPAVRIYTAGRSGGWTTRFSEASPIDADTGGAALMPQLAIDATGQVYVTFCQDDGSRNHIYLCRFNGIDVRIWDVDVDNWTAVFADGDPIDTDFFREADSPQIAIDSGSRVFVAYRQEDGNYFNLYVNRFSTANSLQVWNSDFPAGWTTTLNSGDPVGLPNASGDALAPSLTIDTRDRVYLAYAQRKADNDRLFMTRFDGTAMQLWSGTWRSDRFDLAQPLDTGDAPVQGYQVIGDANDNIYVAFGQTVDEVNRLHLMRWNGTQMQIWRTRTPGWTTSLINGDPIDAATGQAAFAARMAVDSADRIYLAYQQRSESTDRVYLSRYEDTASPSAPVVRIWDQDDRRWTSLFSEGDPIDAGTGGSAVDPQLAADDNDNVFIAYAQNKGSADQVFLNVYEIAGVAPTPPPPDGGEAETSCFIHSMGPLSSAAR